MKYFLILFAITLSVFGYHHYGKDVPLNITMTDGAVTVDAGDFLAEFSTSNEFKNTYMLFGGDKINARNIINPIVLSGLEMADAAAIYSRYQDFHLCRSAGAPLAQKKIYHLNLIPADQNILNELNNLVEEHRENFAKGIERVCATISGKLLVPQKTEVEGKDSTKDLRVVHKIPNQPFYLINGVEKIECKSLLDEINKNEDVPTVTDFKSKESEYVPPVSDPKNSESEIERNATAFLKFISKRDIEGAYEYTTNFFKNDLPRRELLNLVDYFFSERSFSEQEKTNIYYYPGWVETSYGRRDAIIYEYHGIIKFSDGDVRNFIAAFVEENGEWKIQRIDIAID